MFIIFFFTSQRLETMDHKLSRDDVDTTNADHPTSVRRIH